MRKVNILRFARGKDDISHGIGWIMNIMYLSIQIGSSIAQQRLVSSGISVIKRLGGKYAPRVHQLLSGNARAHVEQGGGQYDEDWGNFGIQQEKDKMKSYVMQG
ncbi:hypothetical protein N7478_010380 [Penicillium angulare]|uniref:uncharacterized protein n=1 Tax=Penicillium angulare TaxID=116970 RepID=UPI002541F146|nr:uncharacterized protein N7478_010380 [Penicillium angulare]KAJ5267572.1 hypothetical protein N7478_010380 [Penicillium angulare]